jgi:hypothetical protein
MLSVAAGALPAAAADPTPPVSAEQVLQGRVQSLDGVMRDDPADSIAKVRNTCAAGHEPEAIAKGRGFGSYTLPDAADDCATILDRSGRDGALLTLYRDLMQTLTSGSSGHERIPAAIAATVMKTRDDVVPLGNGKGAKITAALAFDAGFTVAYPKHDKYAAGMPTAPALKPIAQRCLSQREPDLSLCYATGYAYGVLASNRMQVTAVSTPVR